MAVLIDNKNRGRIIDTLKAYLKPKSRIAIVTNNFTIFAYNALRQHIEKAANIKVILENNSTNPSKLLGGEKERRFRNSLIQSQIAKDCVLWLEENGEIKFTNKHIHQNLIIIENTDGNSLAITGSSAFTSTGLGLLPSGEYQINTAFHENEEIRGLTEWFESLWSNPDMENNQNKELISALHEIAKIQTPEELYYNTLYHIFF